MIASKNPVQHAPVAGIILLLALAGAHTAGAAPAPAPDAALLARALEILQSAPLIDGHNDLPWYFREHAQNHLAKIDLRTDTSKLDPPMNTDIARLRRGGLGGQFWSVYVPVETLGADAVQMTLEQIDDVHRLAALYPDVFEIARSAADIERIRQAGRIASLVGMEGGHSIHNSLAALRMLYAAGARYMTITHTANTDWADAATAPPQHGGLTRFGEEVIHEMNRLGMLVDLSHVAPETMKKAIAASAAPVIFSHSSCRALVDHPRNVPDDVLRLVPANRGVVMVTFVERFDSEEVRADDAQAEAEDARLRFLHPEDTARVKREGEAWRKSHPAPRATLAQVADHIEHVRDLAGVDSIGIGSDFDGMPTQPLGLESVAEYPALFAELLRRGWTDADLAKVAGGNVLRALREAEAVAARLQKERPASDALIEELDHTPTEGAKPAAN